MMKRLDMLVQGDQVYYEFKQYENLYMWMKAVHYHFASCISVVILFIQ